MRAGLTAAALSAALGAVGCGAGLDLAPTPQEAANAVPEPVGTGPGELRPVPTERAMPFRLVVDLGDRDAEVMIDTVPIRGLALAIGTSTTPTPTGKTRVVSVTRNRSGGGPLGCCVLTLGIGTSGAGRVRIHGTTDEGRVGRPNTRGDLVGRNADMRWLAANLGVGTPVTIKR